MKPITDEQMAFFEDQGYLMVRGLLDQEEVLDPVIEEYGTVLDQLAEELYLAGKIESRYEDLPFGERITKVWGESGAVHQQYFDFTLPQGNIKEDTPFWCGPAVFDVLTNPRLLDAVEVLHRSRNLFQPGPARAHQAARAPDADQPRHGAASSLAYPRGTRTTASSRRKQTTPTC